MKNTSITCCYYNSDPIDRFSYVLAVILSACVACWARDPDPNDPYAVSTFGITKGEPITNGFLFVNGRYVDSPYVVEERGYAIFVNGIYVKKAVSDKVVYPSPPVTEDPGLPKDLSRTNRVQDAFPHPVVNAKYEYLRAQYEGKELIQNLIDYYKSLPSVAKIERDPEAGIGSVVGYRLYGFDGSSMLMTVDPAYKPPTSPHSKERIQECIKQEREIMEKRLKLNRVVFYGDRSIEGHMSLSSLGGPDFEVISILRSNMNVEEKVAALRKLDFLGHDESVDNALNSHKDLLTNFQASPQLEVRLRTQRVVFPKREDSGGTH